MGNAFLSIVFCALLCACQSQPQVSEISFEENPGIFQNPGQGWMRFGNALKGSKNKINFGAGYSRFLWVALEPKEGVYNWEPIDKALENFSKQGLPFYFRILPLFTIPFVKPAYLYRFNCGNTSISSI